MGREGAMGGEGESERYAAGIQLNFSFNRSLLMIWHVQKDKHVNFL